jgi:hypothetical protein
MCSVLAVNFQELDANNNPTSKRWFEMYELPQEPSNKYAMNLDHANSKIIRVSQLSTSKVDDLRILTLFSELTKGELRQYSLPMDYEPRIRHNEAERYVGLYNAEFQYKPDVVESTKPSLKRAKFEEPERTKQYCDCDEESDEISSSSSESSESASSSSSASSGTENRKELNKQFKILFGSDSESESCSV